MKFLRLGYCFVLILFVFSGLLSAAEKIYFGAYPVPLIVEDENNGVLIKLTQKIAQKANLDIEIIILSPKRLYVDFFNKKIDVYFPALDESFSSEDKFIKTEEIIYAKKDFIFTRKGDPLKTSIADLGNIAIGITSGYPYSKELMSNTTIDFKPAKSAETGVKMLLADRFDAFVAEEKSALSAFRSAGLIYKIQYDPDNPVSIQPVYYATHDDEKGKQLAELISKILVEMKADGSLDQLLSELD